jgi:hypothetical protein
VNDAKWILAVQGASLKNADPEVFNKMLGCAAEHSQCK